MGHLLSVLHHSYNDTVLCQIFDLWRPTRKHQKNVSKTGLKTGSENVQISSKFRQIRGPGRNPEIRPENPKFRDFRKWCTPKKTRPVGSLSIRGIRTKSCTKKWSIGSGTPVFGSGAGNRGFRGPGQGVDLDPNFDVFGPLFRPLFRPCFGATFWSF